MVPLVLLIYDTLLTFSHEVDLFWKGKMTGARILFHANRYISLFYTISGLIELAPFSDKASYQALWLVQISDTLLPLAGLRGEMNF